MICRGGDTCSRESSSSEPCLFHPAQRSTLFLKLAVLILHLFFSGLVFLFYSHFTTAHPWYMTLYLVLFVATIAQYFFTSGSSPGYIHDALGMVNESNALATTSIASKQPASSKNGSFVITMEYKELGKSLIGSKGTSWTNLVMDMYPPGSSCRYTPPKNVVKTASEV